MIVVAIIGILAAVAIPAYQDYTVRAKVAEGLSLSAAAKTGVAEYWSSKGVLPSTNASVGLPTSTSIKGNSTSSVAVGAGGVITVTTVSKTSGLPVAAAGKTFTLTPATTAGGIQWTCKNGTLPAKYLPSDCR
jgi:type IV pilus assembly protein PilA